MEEISIKKEGDSMGDIKKPSKIWIDFKTRKAARDRRLESWRDGAIIMIITILGMIEI